LHQQRDEQQRAHRLELRHERPSPTIQQQPGDGHAHHSQDGEAEQKNPEFPRDFAPG
jgi:hypothetical protein